MTTTPSLPVEGYPKLAYHMGRYTQSAIYRKFSSLNSQNILYMQAELIHLEEKLRGLEIDDSVSKEGERSNYSKDWYWLGSSIGGQGNEQWETAFVIREKLREYNEAIIQQSVVNKLSEPNPHDLRSLQQYLERPNMGNLALIGKDRDTWGDSSQPISPHMDLLCTSPAQNRDVFSIWFTERFISWIHRILWHRVKEADDEESGIVSYDESVLHRFTSHTTTIVASLLPVLAIVVLYCVGSMRARLGFIALFTFAFTCALSFFTRASRGEIFIATSTFAAVQVVFISTGNEGVSFGV